MDALSVELHEQRVGTLELFDDESQRFTFDEEYCSRLQNQRPVLGQIFEDRFPSPIDVGGPICWFAHLLPQGVMRRWRSRLLGIDEDDSFGFLKRLGGDLPGAIVMNPADPIMDRTGNDALPKPEQKIDCSNFQFSLAGAQWKLSARSSGRGLTTTAASGGISYIAKFHSPEYPGLPLCEFATMTWARESGIELPSFELRNATDFDQVPDEMPLGDGKVFVIERFDRSENQRIHIEDFGQILDRPPGTHQANGSHEELGSVIKWIAPDSKEAYLKQVVFNIIGGNGDAHLKNFSVLYPDGRNAVLTPAYDLVSTVLYFQEGKEDLSLKLNDSRSFRDVELASFNHIFRAMNLSAENGQKVVKETVDLAIDAWKSPAVRENFSQEQINKLEKHIASIPLTQ